MIERWAGSSPYKTSMMQSVAVDPASRVVCGKCGYVSILTRFHRIEKVEGVYCRGCGGVVGRNGQPVTRLGRSGRP